MRTSIAPRPERSSRSWFGVAGAAALAVAMLVGTSSPQSDSEPAISEAECLQLCFEEYTAALEACNASCSECVQWLGPICLVRVINMQCYNACVAQAKAALRTCQANCSEAAQP